MAKVISVPASYAVYRVEEDTFNLLHTGVRELPPVIVLETMAAQGQAERVGVISVVSFNVVSPPHGEGDETLEGPWIEEDE